MARTITPLAELVETVSITGEHARVGWGTATRDVAEIREITAAFPHASRTRRWFQEGTGWTEGCYRCAATGNFGFGPHQGICYECNGYGASKGRSGLAEAEMLKIIRTWALGVRRASIKAQAAYEARQAEIAAWRVEHADMIAWAKALTPSAIDRDVDSYVVHADTIEELQDPAKLAHCARLARTEVLENGQHWGLYLINHEHFDYAHKVQEMIIKLRAGADLDRQDTAYLNKVIESSATRGAGSRHAAEEGKRPTITGRVKVSKVIDGDYGSSVFLVVEGVGADTGITWVTSSTAESVWALEAGDTITMTATIKRHEVKAGTHQDRVTRPKVAIVEAPQEAQQAPTAPAAPQPATTTPEPVQEAQKATEDPQEDSMTQDTPSAPQTAQDTPEDPTDREERTNPSGAPQCRTKGCTQDASYDSEPGGDRWGGSGYSYTCTRCVLSCQSSAGLHAHTHEYTPAQAAANGGPRSWVTATTLHPVVEADEVARWVCSEPLPKGRGLCGYSITREGMRAWGERREVDRKELARYDRKEITWGDLQAWRKAQSEAHPADIR